MTQAILLKDVSRIFSERFALLHIQLEIPEGEAVVVTGPNGSGKTTLLRLMSTLLRPSSGEIAILGRDAARDYDVIRPKIGALFVEGFLYGDLAVRENLRFYGAMYGLDDLEARITSWLERFRLGALESERVRYLSKGERQRVSLIRSLLHDPSILLWDEPTNGLDEAGRSIFAEAAREQKGKKTLVCVTHDPASTSGWADRVIRLENGRLA